MGKKIELIGQRFGKLTVIEETSERKNKSVVWKCQCDCGNICYYSTKNLRSDGVKSCRQCGVHWEPNNSLLKDLTGQKINNWIVLEKTIKQDSKGEYLYKCQCDCVDKTIRYINRTDLITGRTKSCISCYHKYHIGDKVGVFVIKDYNKNRQLPYLAECQLCHKIKPVNNWRLENNLSCGCRATSKGEAEIELLLKQNNIEYKTQYVFPKSKFRYDFAIFYQNKLYKLIEFDGEQHYEWSIRDNDARFNREHYETTHKNDQLKTKLAADNNVPLIRIPYTKRGKITIQDLQIGEILNE